MLINAFISTLLEGTSNYAPSPYLSLEPNRLSVYHAKYHVSHFFHNVQHHAHILTHLVLVQDDLSFKRELIPNLPSLDQPSPLPPKIQLQSFQMSSFC